MAVRSVVATRPAERGHIGFALTFTDETGEYVIPDELGWKLTDEAGTVISSAPDVTPATSVTVVLSGVDLALTTASMPQRKLLVEWTFSSDLGDYIPAKHEIVFTIDDMAAV